LMGRRCVNTQMTRSLRGTPVPLEGAISHGGCRLGEAKKAWQRIAATDGRA
jgi:hypothetical protein